MGRPKPEMYFARMPLPVVAAVINPLPHDSMVGVQVNGDIFVFWIQHVAKLLQSAVF